MCEQATRQLYSTDRPSPNSFREYISRLQRSKDTVQCSFPATRKTRYSFNMLTVSLNHMITQSGHEIYCK